MIRNVLQSIANVDIYPVISLAIFMSMFAVLLVWFFKVSKSHLETMAALPLDEDTTPNSLQ